MSKVDEKEVIYEKIPWIWIIPAIVFLSSAGIVLQYFLRAGENLDLGKLGYLHYFNVAPIIVYFIILVIARAKQGELKIGNSTFAYIFAVTSIALMYGGFGIFNSPGMSGIMGIRYYNTYGLAERHVSYLWSPSKETLAAFISGGAFSSEWIPVIIYWSIFGVALWFCIVGFGIFLRYQWIDVENLPYPYATVSIDFIESFKKPKGSGVKLILIGALIGFIFWLPAHMRAYFAWFPDLYGWFNPVTHNIEYWGTLRPQNVFPSAYQSAVGLTQITYNPLYIALAMFIPLNTLLSASFFYIVYILVGTQIAYYMGYYTGINTASDSSRTSMLRHQPPIILTVSIEHGLIIATLMMAVLLNYRNTILRPLRLALGKGPSKLEEQEPVSYRIALIMMLTSSIIIVGMLTISGFTVDDALIFLLMSILMLLAYARVRGYTGVIPIGAVVGPMFFRWKYPNVTMPDVPRSFYLYGVLRTAVTDPCALYAAIGFPVFESWRMGANLGVNNRNLFKVMGASAIIAPFVAFATFVGFGSIAGFSHTGKWVYAGLPDVGPYGTPMRTYTTPALHVWPYFLGGAFLAVFLSYMLYHFVWWPLDPVGAFIATGGPGVKIGLGWVFIIAFIIKYLVLRFGGTKMYSDKAVPIALGFILGTGLATLLGAIIGVITFIHPI